MTACVNKKSKRVAAVVTASLVGALSIGAPAVALAEGANIETLSVSAKDAFSKGELTYAYDQNGLILANLDNLEFEVGSDSRYPVPATVLPANADNKVNVLNTSDAKVEYFKKGESKALALDYFTGGANTIGSYVMKITMTSGNYAGGVLSVPFKVVAKSLNTAKIYDASGVDVSDDTFTYTKAGQSYGFLVGGKVVNAAKSFDVKWYYTGTGKEVAGDDLINGVPGAAGNYTAVLEGKGDYKGSEKQIDFSVDKLDLSTAAVSVSDVQYSDNGSDVPATALVNSLAYKDQLDITMVSSENGSSIIRDKTTYTVKVAPSVTGAKNFTGSQEVNFSVVGKLISADQIKYAGTKLSQVAHPVFISDHKTHVDIDDITCDCSDAKLTIVVTNAAGEEVPFETVNTTPGNYTVSVRVDAKNNSYKYGSDTTSMKVITRKGSVNADANLTFKYDGDIVDNIIDPTYNGENVLDSLEAVATLSDGTKLVEGEDYDVTVYDCNLTKVDKVVDAGNYLVLVSSDVYEFSGDCALWISVAPVTLDEVSLASNDVKTFGDKSFIPYTGNDAEFHFTHMVDGKEVAIPDGVISLDHFTLVDPDGNKSDVEAINALGEYKAYFTLADDVVNYRLTNFVSDNTLTVGKGSIFSDVSASDWFADAVYQAKKQGYINGLGGTTLFAPNKSITRADVAVVLFNMAGGWRTDISSGLQSQWVSYSTKFSDVDGGAYYAKAIGWASKLGVVNGYPDGSFKPEKNVTREEFAAMLSNYARALNDFEAPDADESLAGFPDSASVSDWAEEAVAWAVEADVIHGYADGTLRPSGNITRAEAAAMAVNYQAEKLDGSDLLK